SRNPAGALHHLREKIVAAGPWAEKTAPVRPCPDRPHAPTNPSGSPRAKLFGRLSNHGEWLGDTLDRPAPGQRLHRPAAPVGTLLQPGGRAGPRETAGCPAAGGR